MDLGKARWATRWLRPGRTSLLAQEQVMTEEPERPTGRSLAKGWGGRTTKRKAGCHSCTGAPGTRPGSDSTGQRTEDRDPNPRKVCETGIWS